MQSLLEELYNGNLQFDTGYYPPSSLYVRTAKKKLAILEQLSESLNSTEKELLEQYFEAQSDMDEITRFDMFADTLRFGIRLMAELYAQEGGSAGERMVAQMHSTSES